MCDNTEEYRTVHEVQTWQYSAHPYARSISSAFPYLIRAWISDEVVLRHATEHTEQTAIAAQADTNIAPAPLLPNFGAAAYSQYVADINMLNLVNAKERTLEEFISLGCV